MPLLDILRPSVGFEIGMSGRDIRSSIPENRMLTNARAICPLDEEPEVAPIWERPDRIPARAKKRKQSKRKGE